MASLFGLRAFSGLVSEMNALAQETDAEGLARWTVDELARKIGFECAWYGWAQIDDSGVTIHANATLNLPEDYFSFWTSMAEQDLLAARLLKEPGAIATYDRHSGDQNDGMTALADRYGLGKIATVMNHREGRLASFYLSSYRLGQRSRGFEPQEQEFLQCAIEQLGHAMKLSALSRDSMVEDGSISILVNESGIGILGLGNLREQLGDFFREWQGDLLPEQLRSLIAYPGQHLLPDRGIVVTCERAPDYQNMGLRRLTIRRMTPVDFLTVREREVGRLLAGGHSHKDVARMLGVAPNTVRNQTQSIYEKTGVNSRAELASLFAGNHGS
ncbi:MAG: LuxR C-terminal-related transcriptional regulator [Nitratireductor sp.]